ncbi:hypothetical protein OROHE_020549 [Orobanche hederae]
MSPIEEVIGLKSIDKHTRQCSVVGRILRLWVQKDKTKKEGLEMFLIDAEGYKIQVSIPPSRKTKMMSILAEGRVVKISNFKVEENNPPYQKAKLNNRWKLTFLFSTKASEFNGSMIISSNGFDFIPLRDIYSYDKNLILDVMGEVRRPGKMEYVESAGGRKYDIVLADFDGTEIECTLWEGHAELVKQAVDNKAKDDREPTFVALQFVMISSYKDVRRISTMKNATKLFLNPEFQEVKDFIKRRSNGESSSCRTLTVDSDNDEWLDMTSIRTIFGLKSSDKAGIYTTKAKIIDVDANEPWYYELCGNVACFKRVDLGKMVGDTCNKCSAPIGSTLTRFRIRILVADHSGQTYFTLVESSAPYFVNKSATQLKKETDESDDPNELPDSFNILLERECLFKVEVSDRFHIQSKKDGYTVKKVTEHVDLLAQFPSVTCIDEIASRFISEGEVVSTDKGRTEGSYSETIEESSSTSITPLKRVFDSIVEEVQQSAIKASKS